MCVCERERGQKNLRKKGAQSKKVVLRLEEGYKRKSKNVLGT